MKFTRTKLVAAAAGLLLLAAGAVSETVSHNHMRRGGGMFGQPMLGFFMHRLDLNSDQQAQVKQILAKEKPTMRPLMQQMAQTNIQLTQLELNGNAQDSQINTLATQQAQTMNALVVQQARIESELIQVLTSDQKTKLAQMLNEHQQRLLNHGQTTTPNPATPNQ